MPPFGKPPPPLAIHKWRVPSSKGEHVRTPRSTNHTCSVFMAHTHTRTHAHTHTHLYAVFPLGGHMQAEINDHGTPRCSVLLIWSRLTDMLNP